jgi:hypothetical protein
VGYTVGEYFLDARDQNTSSKPVYKFENIQKFYPCKAGPCHHGMALLEVEDEGTASNVEGSCEYTE